MLPGLFTNGSCLKLNFSGKAKNTPKVSHIIFEFLKDDDIPEKMPKYRVVTLVGMEHYFLELPCRFRASRLPKYSVASG
jgi:hypothetical protein